MKLSLPKNNIKISNLTRVDYIKLVVIGAIVVIPPVVLAGIAVLSGDVELPTQSYRNFADRREGI